MDEKNKLILRITSILLFLSAGFLFNLLRIGMNNKLGMGSIGNWFFYVAGIMIVITVLRSFNKKQKKVDERMNYIGWKSSRVTYLVFIIAAFIIMIIDATKPIEIEIYMLMNYMICGFLLVYIISYKILERYN